MNVRDLEYLVALSEYKHFRRAAEACKVSQPTLSGQIRKLEEELNTQLLERTSRKVLFTESGLQLVEQARQVLREIKQFKDMASMQTKEMTGPLHIGVIPTLGPSLMPYIATTIQQEFPKIELFLHEAKTAKLAELLEMGKIDCAILPMVAEVDSFIAVPMFEERMYLAVPARDPLAKEKVFSMPNLQGKELLMLEDGHCLRDKTIGYCFAAGATENRHYQATSLETLRNMVAAGLGITLMPELAIPNSCDAQIKYIPCVDPIPTRRIDLVYRPGSPLRQRYERIAKAVTQHVLPVLEKLHATDE